MPRFAAIDMGSNASRLLIVQAKDPQRVRPFRSLRIPVRMGHEVFQTGRLHDETLDQAVVAMRRFHEAMEEARVDAYRAVVTASARGAKNGHVLIGRVRDEAGIVLDSIDGTEEARLVALAAREKMELPGHSLLMDLGGGSLELSELKGEDTGFTVSLAIGTVRLLEAFLKGGDPIDKRQDRLVREYIDRLLAPHRRKLRRRPWTVVVGTGGNLEATATLCPAEGAQPVPTIDVVQARDLLEQMRVVGAEERAATWDLKPDRADVIVPALYVIVAMAEMAQVERIAVPGVGLKEGIVRELVAKHYRVWDYTRERDKLLGAALQLGRRYHFDERHATQVSALACELFDHTEELHQLGTEDRGLLRLAALLHDIGDFVNPTSHHKHTQYLIENSDLMGLPAERRTLVAMIARYHRRATPNEKRHAPFKALSPDDRERVRKLAAILRVADALDRGHRSKVDHIKVRLKNKSVLLEAMTEADISLESWTVDRKAELFREVFGRDLKIEITEMQRSGTRELPSDAPGDARSDRASDSPESAGEHIDGAST